MLSWIQSSRDLQLDLDLKRDSPRRLQLTPLHSLAQKRQGQTMMTRRRDALPLATRQVAADHEKLQLCLQLAAGCTRACACTAGLHPRLSRPVPPIAGPDEKRRASPLQSPVGERRWRSGSGVVGASAPLARGRIRCARAVRVLGVRNTRVEVRTQWPEGTPMAMGLYEGSTACSPAPRVL